MELLDSVISFVEGHLMASSAIVATVLEFLFRLLPTKKPLGILHLVSAILKKCAELMMKVASFLDKVLPQNVIDEPKK
jgi:hypothetical protein